MLHSHGGNNIFLRVSDLLRGDGRGEGRLDLEFYALPILGHMHLMSENFVTRLGLRHKSESDSSYYVVSM